MQQLPAFPDQPQHTMTVQLGGRTYRYRRTYRPRLHGWYIDIFDQDGNPVVLGRRLTGEWSPVAGLHVDLPGLIFVRGPDTYSREDLGEDLREVFITWDALPEPAPVADGIREVVIHA